MVDDARTPGSLESQGAGIVVERSLNHQLTSATTFSTGRAAQEGEVIREGSCVDSGDSLEQTESRGAAALPRFQV